MQDQLEPKEPDNGSWVDNCNLPAANPGCISGAPGELPGLPVSWEVPDPFRGWLGGEPPALPPALASERPEVPA